MKKAIVLLVLLLTINTNTTMTKKATTQPSAIKPTFEVDCCRRLKNAATRQKTSYTISVNQKNKKSFLSLIYFPEETKKVAAFPADLLYTALTQFMASGKNEATLLYDKNKKFLGEKKKK